ncbi:MAG: helix-turn-helix domain-containing protein [Sedimentisphaerales bacterium]
MNQPNESLLLKVDEAARRLTVSPRTLWQLTQDGKIRCVRINRLVRYDLQDLPRIFHRISKILLAKWPNCL